ncbi:MAG TPA: DUF4870 domain-containing protein [Steroidobacter sp.]|uniref:DUF4870 family protein n=1 Tax=Steroidobacter sp. TaxID=1978227 RepID=UPI002EDA5EEB
MNQSVTEGSANTSIANIIYVLYLLALFNGITAVIGVIMAYVYRDDAPEWLRTHYEFQIRTFWMALLIGVIGGILTMVLIGVVVLLALAVWWIVRCVKGIRYVGERAPYPNHLSWGI